jgi:hypothetical protein
MITTSIEWMAVCMRGVIEYRNRRLRMLRKHASGASQGERRKLALQVWGLAAAIALLWPSRINGPLDGLPLDGHWESVILGVVLPALFLLHPRFLAARFPRACIVALLGWKAFTTAAFVQDGWCVRMMPGAPYVKDQTGAPHSWDVRADWRSADPACSAIMTGPYDEFTRFPVWFFNLPPPNDSWPAERDRPPGATTGMTVTGYMHTKSPGVLRIVSAPDVPASLNVAGKSASGDALNRDGVAVDSGTHQVLVDAKLTGVTWYFSPLWNGIGLWSGRAGPTITVQRPSALDAAVRPWVTWVSGLLAITFVGAWFVSFVLRLGDGNVLAWVVGASAVLASLATIENGRPGQLAVAGLAAAVFLRVPARLRNGIGAFALVGIPWLVFVAVVSAPQSGHFTLYSVGDDYWSFQRFAYRIYLQGYWLEGGSPTFWFQPLYRWIAGGLHLVFGDSSIGEWYWDGACVLMMAALAFRLTRAFAGFRWGLAAAVTTLTVFTLGTAWGYLGRGLSEISSAGLLSAAALVALKSRHRRWGLAIGAGMLATLAFYTRLNNLPMALAVAVFALPLHQPAIALRRPRTLLSGARTSWPTAVAVVSTICVGVLMFAWRTYHYTGHFSVFYGTQRDLLSLYQPGMSIATLAERMAGSVMMVLTMNDPARWDPYALPLLIGAGCSLLAVAGVPRLHELPLAPVLFCVSSFAGALISRGSAYSGRFSIHVIGIACAVAACTAAALATPWFATSAARRSAASPRPTPASAPPIS